MSVFQILATVLGLLYIYFAVRNKAICFVFGLVGAICWAYEDFTNLNLKFDGALQIFYAGMSIYGLVMWYIKPATEEDQGIRSMTLKEHGLVLISGILASVALAYIGTQFFDTALPYLDAGTTGFSVIATFMLVYRYIENWIYWFVIDLLYIYIYGVQEAWLFVGIMALYVVLSVLGYLKWKKLSLA